MANNSPLGEASQSGPNSNTLPPIDDEDQLAALLADCDNLLAAREHLTELNSIVGSGALIKRFRRNLDFVKLLQQLRPSKQMKRDFAIDRANATHCAQRQ